MKALRSASTSCPRQAAPTCSRPTPSAICLAASRSTARAPSTTRSAECGAMSTERSPSYANPDMHRIVGSHDIVFITLDTLRYDAAQAEFQGGRLPHLARHLDPG